MSQNHRASPFRDSLKKDYQQLRNELLEILFRHDPVGIAEDNPNKDEYAPEVGTILPRLRTAHSVDDVKQILQEEMTYWFGSHVEARRDYDLIAEEIWAAWERHGRIRR